jgi:Lon protease-like protein
VTEALAACPPGTSRLDLFPLRAVLFPGGLLLLRVFEARYLDLVARCLQRDEGFGVVCLTQGGEVRQRTEAQAPLRFETVGVRARIDAVDALQPGLLSVRCIGQERFAIEGEPRQEADGLWSACVRELAADPSCVPAPEVLGSVEALAAAIATLRERGELPFVPPLRLDDAGWVANRWCELLPTPLAARQQLMALADPRARLSLVDAYLRGKQVVR